VQVQLLRALPRWVLGQQVLEVQVLAQGWAPWVVLQ
jgi:hypothetical protein